MMIKLCLVLVVALIGLQIGQGLPVGSSPETYPHSSQSNIWDGGWHGAVPALALVIAAIGLIFGCTWCIRHKDCKTNEGADNQLFTTSASHLHEAVNQARAHPEPANNNISEANNNGPISLREMQNIANNNAAAYIVSENEERNRSRESVVEFLPLPAAIGAVDPLARCADWFAGESFPRSRLQYLREIGRGWFGRVVEGEIEEEGGPSTVAVKILNHNASLEDKARFLDEAKMYRDVTHENVLAFVAKCLEEDPWILMFELCPINLQQYLVTNRPKMAILNESGVPLRLMCDVAAGLAHLHARGYLYRHVTSSHILVRDPEGSPRAVLGHYSAETADQQHQYNTSSEVWMLGNLIWEVCAWGAAPSNHPPRVPDLPCPYRNHLYQIMQLCWSPEPEARPTSAQVFALVSHLHASHTQVNDPSTSHDQDGFERRWQRLKPNSIPKQDEHVAIIHAPSTAAADFTISDEYDQPTTVQDSLSLDMDTAVSRSSSIMSDKDPLSVQIKSESLNNLHGSLDDVRNIYLTHNETPAIECNQGNVTFEEKEDKSDSSMDPWLKEIIAGSHDDVSYYKDVSDVIKNLDNILNSEKTSSSESSHQASPSRDNLSLDCKRECTMQSSLVKSPGISNFQNILDANVSEDRESCDEEEAERESAGTLSHSFERHSLSTSQHTLANLTPDTPNKDMQILREIEQMQPTNLDLNELETVVNNVEERLPKNETVQSELPKLQELCEISLNSVSVVNSKNHTNNDCDSTVREPDTTEVNQIKSKSVENNEAAHVENILEDVVIKSQDLELEKKYLPENQNTLYDPKPIERRPNTQNEEKSLCSKEVLISCQDFIQNEKRIYEIAASLKRSSLSNDQSEAVGKRIKRDEMFEENLANELESNKLELVNKEYNTFLDLLNSDKSNFQANNALNNPECIASPHLNGNIADDKIIHNFIYTKKEIKPSIETILVANATDSSNKHVPLTEFIFGNSTDITKQIIESNEGSVDLSENSSALKKEIASEAFEIHKSKHVPEYIKIEAEHFVSDLTKAAVSAITEKENSGANKHDEQTTQNGCLIEINDQDSAQETTENSILEDIPKSIGVSKNSDHHLENISEELTNETNKNVQHIPENDLILKNEITETPETVQNGTSEEYLCYKEERSDEDGKDETLKKSKNKAFMDLIDDTTRELQNSVHKNVITFYLDGSEGCLTLVRGDSTEYLDLPTKVQTPTHNTVEIFDELICQSTPTNNTVEIFDGLICQSTPKADSSTIEVSPETTEVIDGVVIRRIEQKYIVNSSPPESPTKSHPTDSLDENSSVVLGPFESFSFGGYPVKSAGEGSELPKEELLAFSSNFSEMNLETPSPLRDMNFLKEVPDISEQFDDIETVSEVKEDRVSGVSSTSSSSHEVSNSQGTEKNAAPLTPPNSPGVFLVSTPQQKYLVDIDVNSHNQPDESYSSAELQNEIELNQIELQITSKLAMAENENNMNMEYSGPLVEEGLDPDSLLFFDNDAGPERFLAGNLGSLDEPSEGLTLDEECEQALRNELELKLPLAQVASIEPQPEGEWTELPPPPELIVNYPGALSPIQEETRQQLSAYENDAQWLPSARTDSSESYPEPCNNSTDEVTDLNESGVIDSTFVLHSRSEHNTYTVDKDASSSKRLTMSTDSLNGSPQKKSNGEAKSPVDDKTYSKVDDELNCERISQVSPFLLSPTTDTSAPGNSTDNATAMSTLMKTTVPTDAKSSKPSDTQCLSKATSIDSCCSNDTLYNVEENFDDMALDPDLPIEFDKNGEFRERRHSCGSTYTIHDSKSEVCETFSPDSITENNYTYTNLPRTDVATTTPSATKSDINSGKNSTNDLAYGTLPTYSNCATEYLSGGDGWKVSIPEVIRNSQLPNELDITLPQCHETNSKQAEDSPQITHEPSVKKMDSVEITCLKDNLYNFNTTDTPEHQSCSEVKDSLDHHTSTTPFLTSTPVTKDAEAIQESAELPDPKAEVSEKLNLQTVEESGDGRDISSIANNAFLDESRKKLSGIDITTVENSSMYSDFEKSAVNKPQCIQSGEISHESDSSANTRVPSYSDFEKSALCKPQHVPLDDRSPRSEGSGITSEDFLKSVQYCPQDLSSMIDASSMLLASERRFATNSLNTDSILASQLNSLSTESTQPLVSLHPSNLNFDASQIVRRTEQPDSLFLTDYEGDEEMDQPHSIIITDLINNENANVTYDSHVNQRLLTFTNTFNSHDYLQSDHDDQSSSDDPKSFSKLIIEQNVSKSTKAEVLPEIHTETETAVPNGSNSEETHNSAKNDMSISNSHVDTKSDENETTCSGTEVFATVNFLSDAFEELVESNVDSSDFKDNSNSKNDPTPDQINEIIEVSPSENVSAVDKENITPNSANLNTINVLNCPNTEAGGKMVTEDFLENEKQFCQLDSYFPLLGDIRFTGPASDILTTSFSQDSPTTPNSPEGDSNKPSNPASDIAKEWDSDTDSHSSNSSSGEFIWKDGDGRETAVVPSSRFDYQREPSQGVREELPAEGSGSSCSGSEGDEVEFVPSSWDCSAAPAKSSLRTLQNAQNKKRVVFKRQKYHCVYEYPREAVEVEVDTPATYLPDLSTYCDWDSASAEEAELGYGELFGAPNPLDLFPLRAGISFGADYGDDFFISSSARPFEPLGVISAGSQFFPGKHRPYVIDDVTDDVTDAPPPPAFLQGKTPSLDLTTPDSGVEDITPGSTSTEEYKKLPESDVQAWKADSNSSSESVSPSSPGGEVLGGMRHTRDRLKLELPLSPAAPSPRSPRHARVFSFVLDAPRRRRHEPQTGPPGPPANDPPTPIVMSDETPVTTTALHIPPETNEQQEPPTFSTFGKTNDVTEKEDSSKVETVKGEGTVLDSGDEDSGIESSKATLERQNKTPNIS